MWGGGNPVAWFNAAHFSRGKYSGLSHNILFFVFFFSLADSITNPLERCLGLAQAQNALQNVLGFISHVLPHSCLVKGYYCYHHHQQHHHYFPDLRKVKTEGSTRKLLFIGKT